MDNETYTGGDGWTIEGAVVIKTTNPDEGVKAEHALLKAIFGQLDPNWKLVAQSVIENEGRHYDQIDLEVNGQPTKYFFDITNFYGN